MSDHLGSDPVAPGQRRTVLTTGSRLVLGMIALAVLAGLVSVGFHYWQGRRALEFWGPQASRLIAGAPRAEIWRLAPAGQTAGPGSAAAETFEVIERKDLTNARGLINIRHALLDNSTYDWIRNPPNGARRWQYALRFSDGAKEAVALLDLDGNAVGLFGRSGAAAFKPEASAALRAFCAEQFPGK